MRALDLDVNKIQIEVPPADYGDEPSPGASGIPDSSSQGDEGKASDAPGAGTPR